MLMLIIWLYGYVLKDGRAGVRLLKSLDVATQRKVFSASIGASDRDAWEGFCAG